MFQLQSAEFAEAARTLGPGRKWRVFWRVSLPMARPALAVGVALVLLETLNDIGASEYLGVRTLTVSIFTTWLNRGSLAGAAQISCLMLAIVVALIAARTVRAAGAHQCRVLRRKSAPRRTHSLARQGGADGGHGALPALPLLFGFVVPLLFLMRESIASPAGHGFDPAVYQARRPQFHRARALATLIALAARPCRSMPRSAGGHAAARGASERLVADGLRGAGHSVLALGLLTPLVAIDNGRSRACRARPRPSARPALVLDRLQRRGGDRLCDPLPGGADGLINAGLRAHPARL